MKYAPRKKVMEFFFVCISYVLMSPVTTFNLVSNQFTFKHTFTNHIEINLFSTHPIIFKISTYQMVEMSLMVTNGTGIHIHTLPYFFIAHHNL